MSSFIPLINSFPPALWYKKNFTFHIARHTFATTLAATIMKKSGANIEQIREALGHQSTSTTQKYLDSFDDESKRELSKSLTNFI